MMKFKFLIFSFVCLPQFALADFDVTVITQTESRTIKSELVQNKQKCSGKNGNITINHSAKTCAEIASRYKTLLNETPDTIAPGSDEPYFEVSVASKGVHWKRSVGRLSGNSESNRQIVEMADEILKFNAK